MTSLCIPGVYSVQLDVGENYLNPFPLRGVELVSAVCGGSVVLGVVGGVEGAPLVGAVAVEVVDTRDALSLDARRDVLLWGSTRRCMNKMISAVLFRKII